MSYFNPEDDPNWSYTEDASQVIALRQAREFTTRGESRHSIHRDSPIDGGVYEGSYGGEAIVVDSSKYPEITQPAIDAVMDRIRRPNGRIDKSAVLKAVYEVVKDTMQYNQAAVEDIFQDVGKGRDGAKIALDQYILKGVGVCRHQALYAGMLLEHLAKEGIIQGHVSVERNMVLNSKEKDDKYDGHSWVRYTNSAGEVFIIDVAQKKIDRLDTLMVAREQGNPDIWDYARKEDIQAFRQRQRIGKKGLIATIYPPSTYTNSQGIIDKLPWK